MKARGLGEMDERATQTRALDICRTVQPSGETGVQERRFLSSSFLLFFSGGGKGHLSLTLHH